MSLLWRSAAILGLARQNRRDLPRATERSRLAAAAAFILGAVIAVAALVLVAALLR